MEAADINSALTKNCPHPANHPRHVAISHDNHVAMRQRFDMKAVDFSNASFTVLTPVIEDCARKNLLATVCYDSGSNCRRRVTAGAHVRGRNVDAPFFCDDKAVNYVHARTHVS